MKENERDEDEVDWLSLLFNTERGREGADRRERSCFYIHKGGTVTPAGTTSPKVNNTGGEETVRSVADSAEPYWPSTHAASTLGKDIARN